MKGCDTVSDNSGQGIVHLLHGLTPVQFPICKRGTCSQTETAAHTSDRTAYRRCRRKWHLSSAFRLHLKRKPMIGVSAVNPKLWFGSMIHFVMEDYHGLRLYSSPEQSIRAYIKAHLPEERPMEWRELGELGIDIMNYYTQEWLPSREHMFKTVWLDGKPLVEISFSLVLEELSYYRVRGREWYNEVRVAPIQLAADGVGPDGLWYIDTAGNRYPEAEVEYRQIVYHGTFDRIVEDQYGQWWVWDYKTARAINMSKLDRDSQMSAYAWAAEQWFNRPFAGVIHMQMRKEVPNQPQVNSKGISYNKQQKTTYPLYRKALIDCYGSVEAAPLPNREYLNALALDEDELGDAFIRIGQAKRTHNAICKTYQYILEEVSEMLNPATPIYPNPTDNCSWDCDFKDLCLAVEDGEDVDYIVNEDYEPRIETMDDILPDWVSRLLLEDGSSYILTKYERLGLPTPVFRSQEAVHGGEAGSSDESTTASGGSGN